MNAWCVLLLCICFCSRLLLFSSSCLFVWQLSGLRLISSGLFHCSFDCFCEGSRHHHCCCWLLLLQYPVYVLRVRRTCVVVVFFHVVVVVAALDLECCFASCLLCVQYTYTYTYAVCHTVQYQRVESTTTTTKSSHQQPPLSFSFTRSLNGCK